MLCWWEERHMDQGKIIESPEIDPHKYVNWLLKKGERHLRGENIVFSTNGVRTIDVYIQKPS